MEPDTRLIVSFDRKGMKQTGDGHFSPIGAYNKESDMVLVLEVARFKYSFYWAPTHVLYRSMCQVDSTTGRPRGWLNLAAGRSLNNLRICYADVVRTAMDGMPPPHAHPHPNPHQCGSTCESE